VEELALAGVLGSATYNATATLGIAALVRPLAVTGIGAQAWLAAALPAALVLWATALGKLGRAAGLLLIATYAGYLFFTFGHGHP
jgi:cation:H+ antiporter